MSDLPDLDLHRMPDDFDPSTPPPAPRTGLWIAATVVVIAAGAAAYFAFAWRPRPAPASSAPASTVAASEPQPLGGKADAVTLPPLDASDTLVRTLVQALSENPVIVAWLPTKGLIRNFTVVVANIADGANPKKHVAVWRPPAAFRVTERDGRAFVDPRSYDRYTVFADAIDSIDPAGAARLYATLKPRMQDAYRDLGSGDQPFDRALERAIVALLETPAVDGPVLLRPKGIGYAYVDDRLESLTAAQKQLLRMGPRNVRAIQTRLRSIAAALGIPASRLPAR